MIFLSAKSVVVLPYSFLTLFHEQAIIGAGFRTATLVIFSGTLQPVIMVTAGEHAHMEVT
ncbi:hypothetical protein C2I18_25285 [Paenibacillus sp. PK3_47]|nr:hypothetical protein C2I18_25285 [Paenibacillus sp. PK3_47]